MHWAAFHGSLEGAKAVRDEGKLFIVKDKEGKTPLMHARAEGNNDVAALVEELEAAEAAVDKKDDGLRKRK
jgi:ankyrin repeat protein